MAHSLYTPEQAAKATLSILDRQSVLPKTVRQDFSEEFIAGRGQTVNVKGPISAGTAKVYTKAQREAREAIGYNDLAQTWFPVTLDTQVYNAVRLPDDFATFTIEDLTREVLKPQAESVVDELASPLIAEMTAIATDAVEIPKFAQDGSNALAVVIAIRKVLNSRRIQQKRTLAIGVDVEQILLNANILQKVNESGSTGVLRDATIGRLLGFEIVVAPELPDDFAIGYHEDAFAHVTRPSKQPQGAAFSATVAEQGYALRWIQHYNPNQLEDQSVVDTFYGATTLDANRAVSASVSAV